MKEFEEEYSHPKLSVEEKALIHDLQFGLWRALGERGERKSKGIAAVVLTAFPTYTGEWRGYELTGLGKAILIPELLVVFSDGRCERSIAQVERHNPDALTAMVGEMLEEILKNKQL